MLRIKEMPFLGTTNLEIYQGGMPPDTPRGRAPPALGFTFTITIPIWNPPYTKILATPLRMSQRKNQRATVVYARKRLYHQAVQIPPILSPLNRNTQRFVSGNIC